MTPAGVLRDFRTGGKLSDIRSPYGLLVTCVKGLFSKETVSALVGNNCNIQNKSSSLVGTPLSHG